MIFIALRFRARCVPDRFFVPVRAVLKASRRAPGDGLVAAPARVLVDQRRPAWRSAPSGSSALASLCPWLPREAVLNQTPAVGGRGGRPSTVATERHRTRRALNVVEERVVSIGSVSEELRDQSEFQPHYRHLVRAAGDQDVMPPWSAAHTFPRVRIEFLPLDRTELQLGPVHLEPGEVLRRFGGTMKAAYRQGNEESAAAHVSTSSRLANRMSMSPAGSGTPCRSAALARHTRYAGLMSAAPSASSAMSNAVVTSVRFSDLVLSPMWSNVSVMPGRASGVERTRSAPDDLAVVSAVFALREPSSVTLLISVPGVPVREAAWRTKGSRR